MPPLSRQDETSVSLKKKQGGRSGARGFSQGIIMKSGGSALGPKPRFPPIPTLMPNVFGMNSVMPAPPSTLPSHFLSLWTL